MTCQEGEERAKKPEGNDPDADVANMPEPVEQKEKQTDSAAIDAPQEPETAELAEPKVAEPQAEATLERMNECNKSKKHLLIIVVISYDKYQYNIL